jgi:1-acyl-sn-glycerol-3-phosphate acyltransferase
MTLFAVDLWLATRGMSAAAAGGVGAFVAAAANWRVAADIVLLGAFGGFYTVPLYALIQARSQPSHRSRIIAANNILNALFIIVSAALAIALLRAGLTIPELFLVVGVMNAAVAVYIYALVPEFLMRFLAWMLIHTFYRVRKEGLEHIPDEGPCVVVCNHVSYVDAVVIAACVRRPIRFVMDHRIFRAPMLSFIFRTMRSIPIASAREDPALKERALAEAALALAAGEIVGIFPEGRLTHTGELNRFRPGVQQIIMTTPVPVVPMALRGLWGSFFSRAHKGMAMRRWRGIFSRIALVVAPPVAPAAATPETLQALVLELRGDAR